jgi:hypothetical protein
MERTKTATRSERSNQLTEKIEKRREYLKALRNYQEEISEMFDRTPSAELLLEGEKVSQQIDHTRQQIMEYMRQAAGEKAKKAPKELVPYRMDYNTVVYIDPDQDIKKQVKQARKRLGLD